MFYEKGTQSQKKQNQYKWSRQREQHGNRNVLHPCTNIVKEDAEKYINYDGARRVDCRNGDEPETGLTHTPWHATGTFDTI